MIKGAIVAIVTPFRNGKVDEEALRRLIEEQIAAGTDGIAPCGTTGESTTLSHEEHDRVIEITVDAVKKRVPVIAGTGSNSTAEALRLTKHAWEAGADAALIVCPYYNRPTQEGLYLHYRAIAEEVPIPIIVYNIQGRTGVNMATETLARLAKIPNIVGVKEASGSLKQMSDVIRLCGPDFSVLSGDDIFTLALLAIGGQGGHLRHLQRRSGRYGRRWSTPLPPAIWRRRAQLHYRMSPLIDALFIETNPIPVKAALAMMGKIAYELRLPLCRMAEKNEAVLKKVMQDYGLIG